MHIAAAAFNLFAFVQFCVSLEEHEPALNVLDSEKLRRVLLILLGVKQNLGSVTLLFVSAFLSLKLHLELAN